MGGLIGSSRVSTAGSIGRMGPVKEKCYDALNRFL
jgi:hypothetical protein